MAITSVAREVSLTTQYLNIPATQGLTANGYWFHYVPVNANNDTLGASIVPYQWDTPLPLLNSASTAIIEGTVPLIEETWEGSTKKYHGSAIEWIGSGTNDITATQETDAFFFGHLGSLQPATDDDAFYWDRMYLDVNSSEWQYYQYHKHLPLSYVQYENGRTTFSAAGYIVPTDKSYGWMISSRAKVGNTTYTSVTARVHTPSIGGAHNSHNDINLPATAGFNYLMGGILKGNSNRFHAMYIRANGSDWNVYIRTYTDAAKSFGAEANIGTFNLADPTFNPSSNQQSQYPVRLSCGDTLDTRFYFPVIMNNATSGFDLEIWSLTSSDNVAGGSLVRYPILTGQAVRPDCMLTTVGDKLYAAASNIAGGGVKLFSFTTTAGTWTDEGNIVTNTSSNYVRIHGFKYNPVDVKYYLLLSGTSNSSGTYLGPGLYSFALTGTFSGYPHLDYVNSSNSYVVRAALASGYLQYNHVDGTMTKYSTTEPQGIATGTSVLQYDLASPKFFNRTEYDLQGDAYYFRGIKLRDGRNVLVGQIENNEGNLGSANSGDFLMTIISDDLQDVHHFAAGGTGDDYITSVIQDPDDDAKLWVTGYTKSELVPKRDIKIHGWCRTLQDGGNSLSWKDMTKDADGNIYLIGNHTENEYMVMAKYNFNYELVWQNTVNTGALVDTAYGIAIDDTNNIYVVGSTQNAGAGGTDALLMKFNSSGTLLFNKTYGTAGNEYANSVCVVKQNGTSYVVMSVLSGTSTIFLVTDTSGEIVEQNLVSNLNVNRVRVHTSTPTSGRFMFAGNDGAGATKAAKFGVGEVNHATKMIQWMQTYAGGATPSEANDIANIDAAVAGVGAGYVIVGSNGSNSLILKVSVDESGGSFTVTKSWARNLVSDNGAYTSVTTTPYTETTKYIYPVGYTTMTMESTTHDATIIAAYDASGTIQWQNTFGEGEHTNERFVAVMMDVLNANVIAAGYTQSHHTMGTHTLLTRLPLNGFGTGAYHLLENPSITYLYQATSKVDSNNANSLGTLTSPSDNTQSLSASNISSITVDVGPFADTYYDGSYGPNGVFNFFLGQVDLNAVQEYFNSEAHKQTIIDASINAGHTAYYAPNIFTFYEVSTVGDGTADDGNIFGYDVIKHSNGNIYCIGQTSGDVSKTNLGDSGVYDYILIEFDPTTEEFEYYQNGTALDEETYSLCELSNGKIAYTGRTSGDLGGPLVGNYDIFLGIFDPTTETSDYYNTGSGLDDRAARVHDLGNNELAIVFTTFGTIGPTNFGSEDIGVIKFNYVTDVWGTAYQTGSTTSELFNQNGGPSCLLGTDKIAIVTNSAGIFADDNQTYGYLDVGVGILDLTTGTWKKYQVGSESSDISTSAFFAGDKILIAGYTQASFTNNNKPIFVDFDVLYGLGAKSSTPEV